MSGNPKQARHRASWLLTIAVLCLLAAACGVPLSTSSGSGDPLPIQEMAQALANEPAEVKFSFQEIFQPDYTTDWHHSRQPFPSNPTGSRGGGAVFIESSSGDYHGRTQFGITPHTDSVQLPPIAQDYKPTR